jgi:hypothetical protein
MMIRPPERKMQKIPFSAPAEKGGWNLFSRAQDGIRRR